MAYVGDLATEMLPLDSGQSLAFLHIPLSGVLHPRGKYFQEPLSQDVALEALGWPLPSTGKAGAHF